MKSGWPLPPFVSFLSLIKKHNILNDAFHREDSGYQNGWIFGKSSKWPLTPPPHFRKIILQIFWGHIGVCASNISSIHGKFCNIIFGIINAPPPLELFRKLISFGSQSLPLEVTKMVYIPPCVPCLTRLRTDLQSKSRRQLCARGMSNDTWKQRWYFTTYFCVDIVLRRGRVACFQPTKPFINFEPWTMSAEWKNSTEFTLYFTMVFFWCKGNTLMVKVIIDDNDDDWEGCQQCFYGIRRVGRGT